MLVEAGLLLLVIFFYFYYEVTKQYGFFKERGVPFSKPAFPFGSDCTWKAFTGQIPMTNVDSYASKEFPKEKLFGYFAFGQPTFIVNDQELAKLVLIKDFEYFPDRRIITSDVKITQAFMLNLKGTEWKQVRSMMSGVFTSGKLKLMFKHIAKVGENFEEYITQVVEKGQEVDMKVVGGLMTLDSIATSGFGIETNSFKEPDNLFRVMALTLVGAPGYVSKFNMLRLLLRVIFPKLASLLKIEFTNPKALHFFSEIVRKTYKQRIESGYRRNDIIDLIVDELKASTSTKETKKEKVYESEFERDAEINTSDIKGIQESRFDEETIMISNAILFFFAGFETTSSGFAICTHQLVMHPEVQEKVHAEIDDVIGETDTITFDMVQNLKYMDCFISECFRHQNFVTSLERCCVKDYRVPGTDITIPKGKFVKVVTTNMTFSDKNFKNPTEFDPDNFAPENKPNKFGLMIFGQGPRNCVGMRYALLTLKLALLYLLRKHRLVKGTKTNDKLEVDVTNFNVFKGGVFMKMESR